MPCFALWGSTLKAETPEFFSTTSNFINRAKENGGLCTWKCFGCRYGQFGIGCNCFLDRKVICTGNKWWWVTYRRDRESKFCRFWCWMWVWGCCIESRNYCSVQAYTFRWFTISLWKMLAVYHLPAEVFYSLCTVQHNKTVCQQLSLALTYLLTYSMEQSPSWEANWFCS